jgi:hypothetical protein
VPKPDVEIFRQIPTADLDRDGWIQTAELQEYARRTIPALAERFPGVLRGDDANNKRPPDPSEAANVLDPTFDRSASFPLVAAPAAP